MSRGGRLLLFLLAAVAVGVLYGAAVAGLPEFGGGSHPYRDRAVAAGAAHATANVVSAVNYDQRALDTFGEETILLGAVIGAAALLRTSAEEREQPAASDGARVLEAVRAVGYVMLPITLLVGVDVIVHGHLTPGGGFQGGIVLGTAVHLLYLTGHYRALERLRPVPVYAGGEAVGTAAFAAFAALGLAGVIAAGAFLANVLPFGTSGSLLSAGTVPLLSVAVGVEVASGVVVLLAAFFEQALRVRPS